MRKCYEGPGRKRTTLKFRLKGKRVQIDLINIFTKFQLDAYLIFFTVTAPGVQKSSKI